MNAFYLSALYPRPFLSIRENLSASAFFYPQKKNILAPATARHPKNATTAVRRRRRIGRHLHGLGVPLPSPPPHAAGWRAPARHARRCSERVRTFGSYPHRRPSSPAAPPRTRLHNRRRGRRLVPAPCYAPFGPIRGVHARIAFSPSRPPHLPAAPLLVCGTVRGGALWGKTFDENNVRKLRQAAPEGASVTWSEFGFRPRGSGMRMDALNCRALFMLHGARRGSADKPPPASAGKPAVDGALAGKARGAHTSPPCGPASDTRPVCVTIAMPRNDALRGHQAVIPSMAVIITATPAMLSLVGGARRAARRGLGPPFGAPKGAAFIVRLSHWPSVCTRLGI